MLHLRSLRLGLVRSVMLVRGLESFLKLGMGLGMIVGWRLMLNLDQPYSISLSNMSSSYHLVCCPLPVTTLSPLVRIESPVRIAPHFPPVNRPQTIEYQTQFMRNSKLSLLHNSFSFLSSSNHQILNTFDPKIAVPSSCSRFRDQRKPP
jgi:hypothetical protein